MLGSTLAALASAAALVAPAQAFFRMPLDNLLVVERVDPIVMPHTVSAHVHSVAGGSNFSPDATYESLRASQCTSAHAKEDMSAYWHPSLYVHWANDTFTRVRELDGGLAYYLFRFNEADKTNVTAFPPGFRMLAGDPFARSYNLAGSAEDTIGWNCLGAPEPTRVEGSGLPVDRYCSDNLRGEVRFPSCWDGVNLYNPDGSHMAYSDGEIGPCPDSHPVRLVTLFMEISFAVQDVEPYRNETMNPSQPFVLAMGDPYGFGWHADFFNGWPQDLLQQAIEVCTDPGGEIEDCPVLELYNRDRAQVEYPEFCHKTPDYNEVVEGNLKALPGCNPITWTREDALSTSCTDVPYPERFTPTVYPGDIPPLGAEVVDGTPETVVSYQDWTYLGCFADNQTARAFPHSILNVESVDACLDAAADAGYGWAGLEYYGQCWVGPLYPATAKLDIGWCSSVCNGNSTQYCGGGPSVSAFSLYQLKRPSTNTTRIEKRHLPQGHARLS
ncbi:uncharacterized protein RHOBADRAFT_55573 [Rhodotorula graminis WP1]|uniref:WSC domain-containing protein n=1 Tax=Rhodotorula graminis (strain WP1) TaxID=578459 RepID=A0A0P9EI14_RHOGW|nr:uncharacterized protein RHOBADRAFT_55573 [Rhodotorula graminis WP1]KPV72906.1 hypothetical protein RHOBADRAFT_55573 [Rhodotorula graminis WP1]